MLGCRRSLSGMPAIGRCYINIVIPMLLKNLREEIDATLARDPAARSRLEVVLCYPGLHALCFPPHGAWALAAGLAARRPVRLSSRTCADRHRNPSRRAHRQTAVHRSRDGRGDRRDRRDRRRLHALPRRDLRRDLADPRSKTASDAWATASSSVPGRRCSGRSASAMAPASGPPRWC